MSVIVLAQRRPTESPEETFDHSTRILWPKLPRPTAQMWPASPQSFGAISSRTSLWPGPLLLEAASRCPALPARPFSSRKAVAPSIPHPPNGRWPVSSYCVRANCSLYCVRMRINVQQRTWRLGTAASQRPVHTIDRFLRTLSAVPLADESTLLAPLSQ